MFADLPLLSRSDLRDHWYDLISDTLQPDSAVRTSTSGTSGQRLETLQDFYRIFRTAAVIYRFRQPYGDPIGMRVAYILSATPDAMAKGVRAPTLQPTEAYPIEAIAPLSYVGDPTIIRGDASLLVRLALHAPGVLKPQEVVLGGEDVTRAAQSLISQAMGAPARNSYGLREVGPVARECGVGDGLHIFEDLVHVEVCDPDGTPLPASQRGEIVVTSLWNRGMPILRYRTGDMGSLDTTPCPCGLRTSRIAGLTGRAYGVLLTPTGQQLNVGPLREAIEALDVLEYAIIQTSATSMRIEVSDGSRHAAAVEAVVAEWRAQFEDLAGMTISVGPLTAPEDGRKRQVFTPLAQAQTAGISR
jgi:phenylacetate-CoA ligase